MKLTCPCGNDSMFESTEIARKVWVLCKRCGKQKKLEELLGWKD